MNYQPPPMNGYPPPPLPPPIHTALPSTGGSGPPSMPRSVSSTHVQIGEPSPREYISPVAMQHNQQHQQYTGYAPPQQPPPPPPPEMGMYRPPIAPPPPMMNGAPYTYAPPPPTMPSAYIQQPLYASSQIGGVATGGTRCLDGSLFVPSSTTSQYYQPPGPPPQPYGIAHHHQQPSIPPLQQQVYQSEQDKYLQQPMPVQQKSPPRNKQVARIDPSQMPKPYPPVEDLVYNTRSGSVRKSPPYINDHYQAIDTGNAIPRHLRVTMTAPPATNAISKELAIPFAVVAMPFGAEMNGEEPVPLVNHGDMNPLRCTRCNGYINCSVSWKEDGNAWMCNLCGMRNETPPWYYCSLDGAGLRRDREAKSELTRGSVDFVVKKEDYCTRPIQVPNFIFGIDISQYSVEIGYTAAAITAVRCLISELRERSASQDYRVGIYTFNSVGIQFFQMTLDRAEQIKIFQVDVDDPCGVMPPNGWILPVSSRMDELDCLVMRLNGLVDKLLADEIRASLVAPSTDMCSSSSLAAIRVVQQALDGNGGGSIGGAVYMMTPSTPSVGYGKLSNRETGTSIYGADGELELYSSIETAISCTKDAEKKQNLGLYVDLAAQCAQEHLCINVLLGVNNFDTERFKDAAVFGEITFRTGGELHLVRGDMRISPSVLEQQLRGSVMSLKAFEAVGKLRTSVGIRADGYIGAGDRVIPHSSAEVEFAAMSENTTMTYMLAYDSALKDEERVYLQLAVLYTTLDGQRLVRVHNMCLTATTDHKTAFKHADLDCVCTCIAKMAAARALEKPLAEPKAGPHVLIDEIMVNILAKYRQYCSSHSSPSQLILPDALKTLPLYMLGLIKHPALFQNSGLPSGMKVLIRGHERACQLRKLLSMTPTDLINSLYPAIYALHALDVDEGCPDVDGSGRLTIKLPKKLCPTAENLDSEGIYLMNDNDALWLYIGRTVPQVELEELFSVPAHARPSSITFNSASPLAMKMEAILNFLRQKCPYKQQLIVIWSELSGSRSIEYVKFTSRLVEDSVYGALSYVDWLCKVHSKIRSLPSSKK